MKGYNLEHGEQKNKVKEFGRQLAVYKFHAVVINSISMKRLQRRRESDLVGT